MTPAVVLLAPFNAGMLVLPLVGLGMIGYGVYARGLFRPLPTELLASGTATPAVVLESGMVGPAIQTQGYGVDGQLMRRRYRIEVRPPYGTAYEVELRTFDGPMLMSLGTPPLVVYVDPRDPKRICPDWSTLPAGA